jgi:acyl CoA:acetate/3-ketoacid CoA transferase
MANNKVITADEAIALIRDNDVVTTTGFVQSCIPEALHAALEKRFVETQHPRDLTLIMTAGAGDSKGLGTGRFHHEGLLRRVIAANSAACRRSRRRRGEQDLRLQSPAGRHLAALPRLRRRGSSPKSASTYVDRALAAR